MHFYFRRYADEHLLTEIQDPRSDEELDLSGLDATCNFCLQNSKLSQQATRGARNPNLQVAIMHVQHIQLFRERLSEKVHATSPKGIVSGFEFTVLQRNLKEWHERPQTYVLRLLKESNKRMFDSYIVRNGVNHIPYYLSGLLRAHFYRQPFLKQLYVASFLWTSVKNEWNSQNAI